MIYQRQHQQRKPPAKRLFSGLGPLARIDKKLEAARGQGRPMLGDKPLSAKERKAKSRLKKLLKPGGSAYMSITSLLKERYRDEPNLMADVRDKMIAKLLEHADASKIIGVIDANPDNLDIYMKDADQGKGLLISIGGMTIDTYEFGQKPVFSVSESIDENQRDLGQKYFMTDESEPKSGPVGKPPKTIRTKWKYGEKFDADNKQFIKNAKAEKVKQIVLAALDCKFTPVEIELEPAITDGDEIIQAAKTGSVHQCTICDETVTEKWQHLEGKHNWLVRKESAKARKDLRDKVNKSPMAVTAPVSVTYEPLQNPAPIIRDTNTSL